nr:hypothetical protein [Mesorhizobium sp.]
MLDQADGLAGGTAAAAFFGLGGDIGMAGAGACIGFLCFNYPPARVFMGGSGSLLLGTAIGILDAKLRVRSSSQRMTCAFTSDAGGQPKAGRRRCRRARCMSQMRIRWSAGFQLRQYGYSLRRDIRASRNVTVTTIILTGYSFAGTRAWGHREKGSDRGDHCHRRARCSQRAVCDLAGSSGEG